METVFMLKEADMHLPYGLQLQESCRNCKLRSDSFFCHLSSVALKALEAIKYTTAYPEGAVLFMEGQSPRGVFVLCKGRVKLSMTSAEGKTVILRIVNPGEALGLHAAVSDKPYQATAETLEPCQVNFAKRDDFLRFLREHAEASIHAAQQLSGSYQIACEQIRSLGLSHSAPQKLARFLLEWSAKGQDVKPGLRAKLTLTHEEIGQVIGTSRETVTRTLGEFKNKQLVSVNGSTLVIQNRAGLENFVDA
jgi:CRP/FNR family transcriptional regulator, cyclic AMP receptor protein